VWIPVTSTRDVVERYYDLANSGDWEGWSGLFATDAIVDEQLAGRIMGRAALREAVAGFPDMYRAFTNTPSDVIVEGDSAAVRSHISAIAAGGEAIEAEVMNIFRFADGSITYMANFHDTLPFRGPLGLDS
jgi:ketosteroid isomerase-like protein